MQKSLQKIEQPEKADIDYSELQYYGNYLNYQYTWALQQFIHLRHKIIALFTGNQAMKTSACAYQYVLRIASRHPVPEKNILYFECANDHKFNARTLPKDWICLECKSEIKIHQRGTRTFRFASDVLPGEKQDVGDGKSAEVKNTVYPEFKKWLPPNWMNRDITYRNMAMMVTDPNNGMIFCGKEYKGDDIIIELVSYKQTVQEGAGVQRVSIWCDEEPPYDFYEEQLMRLMAEDGDLLISLTPANRLSYTYDEVFERAKVYVRTQTICDFLRTKDYEPKQIEFTDSPYSIAVIQAASDDNPTLSKEIIDQKMEQIADPDAVITRRYGIHRQVTGRIFKAFDYKIHFIDHNEYFPEGIPYDPELQWVHGRAIDYHPQTPWACVCMSLSPRNEAFIWLELEISPERYTTKEICREFSLMCKDYKFLLNLIDPESETIKKDNISILDDINREFLNFKRDGIGTGGYFQTWDTKGEKGRDAIRERLMNSTKAMKPFNNEQMIDSRTVYLPTLWILNNCKVCAKSMRMWSWEQYMDTKVKVRKGTTTDKPQQIWSHFNMSIESLFKHPAFRSRRIDNLLRYRKKPKYFQGRK